jgi:hypothetical protein
MAEHVHDSHGGASAFLRIAQSDARLSSVHISLYFVLYDQWLQNGRHNPVSISRRLVMTPARISIATYHKCMTELCRYGYLTYQPSYHPGEGSKVFLNFEH